MDELYRRMGYEGGEYLPEFPLRMETRGKNNVIIDIKGCAIASFRNMTDARTYMQSRNELFIKIKREMGDPQFTNAMQHHHKDHRTRRTHAIGDIKPVHERHYLRRKDVINRPT